MKICKIFGHKWIYDKKKGMKHRQCKRCKLEQWGHASYGHEGGEVSMYGYTYDSNKEDYHYHSSPNSVIGFEDPPDNPEDVNLNQICRGNQA